MKPLMKPLIWLKFIQLVTSSLISTGLFFGGFKLFVLGASAKGNFDFKSSFLSGSITAESAGLVMIFIGVIVFLAPFVFKIKISRDRINIGLCSDLIRLKSHNGVQGQLA